MVNHPTLVPQNTEKSWFVATYPDGTTLNCFKDAILGSCHKRQKPQAPTPQAPIRNRQTRKVANAKGLNHNTNLT